MFTKNARPEIKDPHSMTLFTVYFLLPNPVKIAGATVKQLLLILGVKNQCMWKYGTTFAYCDELFISLRTPKCTVSIA